MYGLSDSKMKVKQALSMKFQGHDKENKRDRIRSETYREELDVSGCSEYL
jgi:hypothetical protein